MYCKWNEIKFQESFYLTLTIIVLSFSVLPKLLFYLLFIFSFYFFMYKSNQAKTNNSI